MLRYRLSILVVLAGLGAVGAGCGGDDDEKSKQAAAPRSFIALAEDSGRYVAVTLSDDGRVEAYVCDGQQVGESFEGSLERDRLSLTSKRDAELRATADGKSVEGTFKLAGEEPLRFKAWPTDKAAIYRVNLREDGSLTGKSTGGGTLDARLTAKSLEGTLTYPSGQAADIRARVVTGGEVHIAADTEKLQKTYPSGRLEEEYPSDRPPIFGVHLAGRPSRVAPGELAREAAGEYRFLAFFDGWFVGRGTSGNTKLFPVAFPGCDECP